MSKQNLKSLTKSSLNLVKISNKIPYRPPKLHCLGSLERMQGEYEGEYIDARGTYYCP